MTSKLQHLGEDRLIATLCRGFASGKGVLAGIGDDCAVLGKKSDRLWTLLKTDAVLEGIHFLPKTAPARIGWKAMGRAVSDIAAMGGVPRHALVTIAAPANMALARAKGIYAGLKKCCKTFDINLVGGETCRSPGPLFLNVMLQGEVEPRHCVLRSGGRPGDLLYVTGRLGGSLKGKHLNFMPRLEQARWLTEHFKLHAMMDLSDGLGSDLPRMAKASGTGFHIEKIPCAKGCTQKQALSDGEDFELLFAISKTQAPALEKGWRTRFPKLELSCIGMLTKKLGVTSTPPGHDHFA